MGRRKNVPRSHLARKRELREPLHDLLRECAWVDVSACRRALRDEDTASDPVALQMVAQQLLGAALVLQETGVGDRHLPPAGICPP